MGIATFSKDGSLLTHIILQKLFQCNITSGLPTHSQSTPKASPLSLTSNIHTVKSDDCFCCFLFCHSSLYQAVSPLCLPFPHLSSKHTDRWARHKIHTNTHFCFVRNQTPNNYVSGTSGSSRSTWASADRQPCYSMTGESLVWLFKWDVVLLSLWMLQQQLWPCRCSQASSASDFIKALSFSIGASCSPCVCTWMLEYGC